MNFNSKNSILIQLLHQLHNLAQLIQKSKYNETRKTVEYEDDY